MKKLLSVFTVCVMIMTFLVGCAKTSETTQATEAAEVTVTEATEAAEATEAVKKDPVTITWYMFGDPQEDMPLVMEAVNKILTPKTNAILDFQLIPYGSFDDKMSMMINAGDDYDLAFTCSWLNNFYGNIGKNALMPLDDLIAEYTPNLTESVPQWVLDVSKVNGKTYAVPNQQIMYDQVGFAVQKALCEKYNFDPKTVKSAKDLEPFLEQVKNGEKDLYPVKVDSYPLVLAGIEVVANFGMIKRDDSGLTVIPNYTSDESKANYDLESEWFTKGYIRSDALTVVDDSADTKADKYALVFGMNKPGVDAENNAASANGTEWLSGTYDQPYVGAASGIATMIGMNVNSKNPAEAMKVLEAINSDKEIYNLLVFGIEGIHYDLVDGFVQVKEDSKYKMNDSAWALGNQFNALYQVGQPEGLWEETKAMNASAQVSNLRGFTFNPEPVATEIAGLNAVKDEFLPILRYGTENREEKWNEFVDKMNAAGQEKVIAEMQMQIDAWKVANGK